MIFMKYVFANRNESLRSMFNDRGNLIDGFSSHSLEKIVSDINDDFYNKFRENDEKIFAMVYEVEKDRLNLMVGYRASEVSEKEVETFISCRLGSEYIDCKEVTLTEFINNLETVYNHGCLPYSVKTIKSQLSIDIDTRGSFFNAPPFRFKDEMLPEKLPDRKKIFERAEEIMASDSMKQELKRIYSTSNARAFYGHPVHYYITAGEWEAAMDMVKVLLQALYKNKRLMSRRISYVQEIEPDAFRETAFENVFSSACNSTIVIDLSGSRSYGNYATGYQHNAEIMGKKLGDLGKDTLFIFVEITDQVIYRDETLAKILGQGEIVQIDEGYGDYKKAASYIRELGMRSEFKDLVDERICDYLPEKASYSVSDVFSAYNRWYGSGLKTHIYKAYKDLQTVKITVKKKKGDPYKTLKEMVGLNQIKNVIDEIVVHEKIQMRRKELGLAAGSFSRHMLFYGNPGTAKTTVARLLAQILKEEGVLQSGHMVECGRQDLVARYVGWTAKTVEEKFKEARGGVLFIDEAYSLNEDGNLFGKEAINTIVQLMENYREEVIVIFAGYPNKMREFIKLNEGLASRIAFQLDFPDYSSEELLGIMELMLKESQYRMSEEAKEKSLALFDKASTVKDFGNGRFVRNFLEQVELAQSKRIAKTYAGKEIGADVINMIEAEDIMDEYNFMLNDKTSETAKIGYAE